MMKRRGPRSPTDSSPGQPVGNVRSVHQFTSTGNARLKKRMINKINVVKWADRWQRVSLITMGVVWGQQRRDDLKSVFIAHHIVNHF